LEQSHWIAAGSEVIARVVDIGFVLKIYVIIRINTLRDTVRANGWCVTTIFHICAIANEVSIVADTRAPRVAFCAEVELPPDAIENVGACIAAVHLRRYREVGRYLPVGVGVWLWGIGLECRRAVGWISLDRDRVVDCACCGLRRIFQPNSRSSGSQLTVTWV
jgi:hypothetical protein